jgi:Membrane protein involved in the export of O-antigen and teichoic acid
MRLRKQVYIYFSSYFINAGLSFLIVSLLTHHLTTYDYGIINLYSSFLLLLMPFVSAGILFPISVEYFKKPAEEYKRFFTNAQALSLLSMVLFTVLCLLFQQPLSRFLKVSPVWIWIMPVTAWWIMINETTMLITRNKNSPFQFALFTVGKTWLRSGLPCCWCWD